MKTYLVILASVLLVMGVIGIAYGATEQVVTASVSVTGAASITVSSSSLDFGSMSEGETKAPTVNPLVITIDANTGYTVKAKSNAATFTGTSVVNDEQLTWATTLAGTYIGYDIVAATVASGSAPGTIHNLYHKLAIPADTVAGSYSLGTTLSVTTP
jgi:hypothetical protein